MEAWIIDTARTPRGIGKKDKGALADVHPHRIFSQVLKTLAERNQLNIDDIDDVVAGCGSQKGKQSSCIARMSALDAGWGNNVVGVTLDRFCGSGLTAVNIAAMGIMSGMQSLVIAGGVESMSGYADTPGGFPILDNDNMHLRALHPQPHQGVCADVIATLEGISREETEQLAVQSQQRAANAIENGYFDKSLVPVYNDDGSLALDKEQFPRPQTTLEGLSGLNPAFAGLYDYPVDEAGTTYKKIVEMTHPGLDVNFMHHAGTSSGIVDGAAALVLASPEYAKANGLKPRARIVTATTAGDAPELMLNAPAPAARKALKMAGMKMSDIDLIEINEAFAVVPLKFMKEMNVDQSIVNVNGGAMALGHPIGATGAVILGTLLDEMERRDLRIGMATLCAAGGMAPCTIIERI